jgi:hypothetical protein
MDHQKTELEQKRRDALERLRANRGAPRRSVDEAPRFDFLGEYLEPFVRAAEPPGRAGKEEIKGILEAIVKARREQAAPDASAEEANWQQMLQEIGLDNFKDSVQRWLASVPVEYSQDSTPVEDMERLHQEARLRLRFLKKLVDFTQQEVDDIVVNLRARTAHPASVP